MARRFRFSVLTLLCGMLLASCLPAFAASSTTTTLAVSPASAAAGSVITMTATVTSGGTPLSAGKVKFCNASAPHCEDSAVLGTVWVTTEWHGYTAQGATDWLNECNCRFYR